VRRTPEFAEYFVSYPAKQSKNSSHYHARALTGRGQEVLEIGCGRADFSAELKKDENRVSGVDGPEQVPQPGVLERFFPFDLDSPEGTLPRDLRGLRFDRVLLLDVLEHRVHPEALLHDAKAALKEHGLLVVSLRNVANIMVRLKLLFGVLSPAERGLLDRSHLHFYTRKTSRRLLEENGYEILKVKPSVAPMESVLGLAPDNPLMRAINGVCWFFTTLLPGLLAYEFVYLAKAKRGQ
jgi:SAM-dependent methyltransferase